MRRETKDSSPLNWFVFQAFLLSSWQVRWAAICWTAAAGPHEVFIRISRIRSMNWIWIFMNLIWRRSAERDFFHLDHTLDDQRWTPFWSAYQTSVFASFCYYDLEQLEILNFETLIRVGSSSAAKLWGSRRKTFNLDFFGLNGNYTVKTQTESFHWEQNHCQQFCISWIVFNEYQKKKKENMQFCGQTLTTSFEDPHWRSRISVWEGQTLGIANFES